ncbi:MAG TPA: threonine synthase [Vicinamibacterales bacterium]|nr:threonine synthase [Vicinamibacterales bacterium]
MSTRGNAPSVSFKEAVRAGLAPDGGLYVPASLERRPEAFWAALRGKTFHDVAIAMLTELAGDEFDHTTLTNLVRDALNFPVRIVELEKGLGVVELFHGPTFAFKDFGARTLARLLALSEPGGELTILVATSGDTGSAVAHAFLGVPGTRVVVMYPEGQVSAIQEAQFTTLGGNVTAVAVQGTFDDCQRLAKEAFSDAQLQSRVRLTSANSISLGRLIPQMFYYAYAATQSAPGNRPIIAVPSGNFGNLVAGVMAWRMGAPIAAFTAPTTINDTVPRYFETGRVEPRQSVPTLANAMDVGNPSNLERLQWLFSGDLQAMRGLVTSERYSDDEVRGAIAELHKKYQYVADPHTAIGYLGAQRIRTAHRAPGALFLSTAHPAKFREVVEPIVGVPVPLPEPLAETLARKKIVQRIQPVLGELSLLL